jgi:hypothetical protein
MAENLQLNVSVGTSGAEASIGSLKKQLREAQNEVSALADKFGATSEQAILAAKKAADLKDRIGDAKSLTDAFNPDAKFKALSSSLAGVAGGFAAVQGAMALFGTENKNVEKTLLKVQSAMALSQGLQAIGESVDSFKQLGAVIKSTSAFRVLDAAATNIATVAQKAFGISVDTTATSFKEVPQWPPLIPFTFGTKTSPISQQITPFSAILIRYSLLPTTGQKTVLPKETYFNVN